MKSIASYMSDKISANTKLITEKACFLHSWMYLRGFTFETDLNCVTLRKCYHC